MLVAAALVCSVVVVASGQAVGADVLGFDGKTLALWHLSDDSVACLDLRWGNASDGQDVQTWECNGTDAQKWKFQKRTSGDYAGSYRLVSLVGDDTYCLDNRGDFSTGDRMGIWSCVDDSHGAAANQSVTITASGSGYTITFVRQSDNKSVWLVTDRASNNPQGGANQATVTDTVPDSAIWHIGATAPDNPPANDPPANDPPVQLSNLQILSDSDSLDLDGKTFELRNVTSNSTGCLAMPFANGTGSALSTAACDGSDQQSWTFYKRTSGPASGTYQIRNNATHRVCVDNAGLYPPDYSVAYGWRCYAQDNTKVTEQALNVTAVTGGYTITFTDGTNSSWLNTNRGNSPSGGAYQITATGTPPANAIWQLYAEPDFDGHIMQIFHTTTNTVGCLTAPVTLPLGPKATKDMEVVTAACDNSTQQHWRLEKRTSGDHADSYAIRSMVYSQLYCLDNDGEFKTSPALKVRLCAENSNYTASDNRWSSLAGQSVTIAASGAGYTLTFTQGNNSSWVSTDRATNNPNGGAGQTTTTSTTPTSAIWGIGTATDRTAGRTNADPPTITDPYDNKTFKIKVRFESGGGWTAGCLTDHNTRNGLASAGDDLDFGGGWMECFRHLREVYNPYIGASSWKVEKRTSGDFAGYYRFVNQNGARDLCIDVDVDDAIDDGHEYTTTPLPPGDDYYGDDPYSGKGVYLDTCVGDTHAEVASQSAVITKLPDKGAWGKNTYTITFADGTGNDARKVWLALGDILYSGNFAGQRVVTDIVHDYATLYLEEQVAEFDPMFLPAGTPPTRTVPTVQIQHVTADSTACLTVPDNTVSNGKELTTAACDSNADGQKWKIDRRLEGKRRDHYYRLVSLAGSDTHCIDNRGDFATSTRMGIWSCTGDRDWAVANQSVYIAASGDGYTLTFHGTNDKLSWLTTDRASDTPAGGVGQTTRSNAVPDSAIWRFVTVS